jgi:type 1 glutamine amidotransferase
MWRIIKRVFLLLLLVFLAFAGYVLYQVRSFLKEPVFDTVKPNFPENIKEKGVLIFSKTNSYRHESIEAGVVAIQKIATARGWSVYHTENAAFFDKEYLKKFSVVIFLSTTGKLFTPPQQWALVRFVEHGGGFVGIHSASDTEHNWNWYGKMIGAHFKHHTLFPQIPVAEVVIEDTTHSSTRFLPRRWRRADEWYCFQTNPRNKDSVTILATVDEKTYDTGLLKGMGNDHPIAWTNRVGKGRVFYTAIGHTTETFSEELALKHITAGIEWAGRLEK